MDRNRFLVAIVLVLGIISVLGAIGMTVFVYQTKKEYTRLQAEKHYDRGKDDQVASDSDDLQQDLSVRTRALSAYKDMLKKNNGIQIDHYSYKRDELWFQCLDLDGDGMDELYLESKLSDIADPCMYAVLKYTGNAEYPVIVITHNRQYAGFDSYSLNDHQFSVKGVIESADSKYKNEEDYIYLGENLVYRDDYEAAYKEDSEMNQFRLVQNTKENRRKVFLH